MTEEFDVPVEMWAARAIARAGESLAALPDVEPDGEAGNTGDADAAALSGTEQAPINGDALLDAVRAFLANYIWLGDDERLDTVALWTVHTWAMEHFTTTPRLCLFSGDEGSGKTVVLEVLEVLTRAPMPFATITFNAFKRSLTVRPTVLFDEVDNYWNDDPDNELLKLLNSGYKASGKWIICVGPNHTPTEFPCFAPVAMAGLDNGQMPNTLKSRSIIIRLKKKRASEHVEPLFQEDAREDAEPLIEAMKVWVAQNGDALKVSRATRPPLPEGVGNREAEIWWPLASIGRAAGPRWHEKAQTACAYFAARREGEKDSPNLQFMRDVREAYRHRDDPRGLPSTAIVQALLSMPGRGYFIANTGRQPIDAGWLAKRMRACSIEKVKRRWQPKETPQHGYFLADVLDWMERHITEEDDADGGGHNEWTTLQNLRGTL